MTEDDHRLRLTHNEVNAQVHLCFMAKKKEQYLSDDHGSSYSDYASKISTSSDEFVKSETEKEFDDLMNTESKRFTKIHKPKYATFMGDNKGTGGSKNGGETIDVNSPFYIHPSDYPKQMQVNDVLSDNNFNDWKQEMINFLLAKNKKGLVDGSIKKPEKTSETYMAWMRADAMIKGWLTTTMERDIRTSVRYANTSAEICTDLEERFGKEGAPRAYELKQSLSITRQNGTSVSAYYTKLRSFWDELQLVLPTPRCTCEGCSCGIGKRLNELKEKERLYEFMMGLDENFSVIRTQILAMKPTPTLGAAYHLVAEDEQQRAITGASKRPGVEAMAFQVSKLPVNEKLEKCTFCGKYGHNKDGCFKRIGYPDWWSGKEKKEKLKPKAACVEIGSRPIPGLTDEQYQLFVKHFREETKVTSNEASPVVNMAGRIEPHNGWVVDSGATEHITHKSDFLENEVTKSKEAPVIIPNGEMVLVVGVGDEGLDWSGNNLGKSCPHTPQQNGVVERKHRHLLETARALRFQASLPKTFWGECVLTATYVINRLPSKVLHDATPYEIVFKQKPNYDHMRVFGCLAYYRSIETGGDKFELRGRPGIFVGYPQGTKGYKVYDIENKKIMISRDVRFVENNFPMAHTYNSGEVQEEDPFRFIPAMETSAHTKLSDDTNDDGPWPNNSKVGPQMEDDQGSASSQRDNVSPTHMHADSLDQNIPPFQVHSPEPPMQINVKSDHDDIFVDAQNIQIEDEILEHLPEGKRAIDSKWVYKIKYKPNGEVERYKARLMVKGYTQMEGVDFHDTFAPVAKLVTIRTLLAVAVKKNWIIHQLDVNNAFLHGDLEEDVYMKIPQVFAKKDETRVCKLKKSLYGLKQASRNWYHKFTTALLDLNFRQSHADHSLFIHKEGNVFVAALVYVDDVIVVGNSSEKIQQTKSDLDAKFSIKDLGTLKYFLGIEVA
ncbi:hypothetical protein L6452_35996 [Arctium lappa]|uniref:Uncharacterized protein n=1 Tax=Arctium lappa TaxID=4217 RepID=A0ACB8Y8W1_ARCLA|nr:hypothetical protein L6452_35996 [Arctium lappa]